MRHSYTDEQALYVWFHFEIVVLLLLFSSSYKLLFFLCGRWQLWLAIVISTFVLLALPGVASVSIIKRNQKHRSEECTITNVYQMFALSRSLSLSHVVDDGEWWVSKSSVFFMASFLIIPRNSLTFFCYSSSKLEKQKTFIEVRRVSPPGSYCLWKFFFYTNLRAERWRHRSLRTSRFLESPPPPYFPFLRHMFPRRL